jgi:hypothetical protein
VITNIWTGETTTVTTKTTSTMMTTTTRTSKCANDDHVDDDKEYEKDNDTMIKMRTISTRSYWPA